MDKWVEAQKKWMYLENIFSAPDIKTQMPMESKDFDTCNNFIRNHVKRTTVKPKIKELSRVAKLLDKFTDTVDSLERI